MPLIPGKSQQTVSKNIQEFHKGDTYAKTAENHGKGTADKQAVAVALKERDKSAKPNGLSDDDAPVSLAHGADHKAAIAKMHPEHLHKMVQDAHAGKFGPQAQQAAQQAMQQQGGQPGQPAQQAPGTSVFSDNDQDDQPQAQPSMGQMFGGN